jgi:hypothetical protein
VWNADFVDFATLSIFNVAHASFPCLVTIIMACTKRELMEFKRELSDLMEVKNELLQKDSPAYLRIMTETDADKYLESERLRIMTETDADKYLESERSRIMTETNADKYLESERANMQRLIELGALSNRILCVRDILLRQYDDVLALKQNDAELALKQNDAVLALKQNDAELALKQNDAVLALKQNDAELALKQKNDAVLAPAPPSEEQTKSQESQTVSAEEILPLPCTSMCDAEAAHESQQHDIVDL